MNDIVKDELVADQGTDVSPEGGDYWGAESNEEVSTPELEAHPDGLVPNQEAPVETQEKPENAGDDQSRYQYWQSRYDQKASEFDNMSKKLAEYEKIAPIAEYIQENPDALKGVARSLSGDTPQVPSQEKSAELPKKPVRPTKPMNYDATEAVMDAESESFKYRQSLDAYRDEMFDYQDKMQIARVEQIKAQEAQVLQQRQAWEAEQANIQMKNQLMNTYGYTDERATEFMQYYQSPESITLDNLVQLDRLRHAPSQQEVATQQKVTAMQNQQKRMQVPTPTAVQNGDATPNYSDEDLFNLGLMANRK